MRREEKEQQLMANIQGPLFDTARSYYLYKVEFHLSHAFFVLHGQQLYERGYDAYDNYMFFGRRDTYVIGDDIVIPKNEEDVVRVCGIINDTIIQKNITKLIRVISIYDSEMSVDRPEVVTVAIRTAC